MEEDNIIPDLEDALMWLVKSHQNTTAPEMSREFIINAYEIIFNLVNDLKGENNEC